jgi:hypothetical protein
MSTCTRLINVFREAIENAEEEKETGGLVIGDIRGC